jgi:hypothetical protein
LHVAKITGLPKPIFSKIPWPVNPYVPSCTFVTSQLCRVKVPAQLDAPPQYHRHGAWTFTIRCAVPTDYFDAHQLSAITLEIAAFDSFSLEPPLQRAQRHSANPAELAS